MTVVSKSVECTDELIRATLMHQENERYVDVLIDDFPEHVEKNKNLNIAANSCVLLQSDEVAHIPMLDFKIPVSSDAIETVKRCVKQIGLRGYVLDSGKSYHFWGRELVSSQELRKILGRFVLLHPISDKSWAAHQLIEGSASLRISAKYGRLPMLVDEVV